MTVKTDIIAEYTNDTGVTVDGLLIKDGKIPASGLPAATESAQGAVELATTAEAATGTDTERAVTPAGLALRQIGGGWALGTGGDARGAGAVDLQVTRSGPNFVASGAAASIGGGQDNTAAGPHSSAEGYYTLAGGKSATAALTESTLTLSGFAPALAAGDAQAGDGIWCWFEDDWLLRVVQSVDVAGNSLVIDAGYGEDWSPVQVRLCRGATGDASHAEGNASHAEGDFSHAEGYASHAEGYASHAEGNSSHAEGYASHAEGNASHARLYAEHAHAAGRFATAGDAQRAEFVARKTTTDATPTVLFLDGAAERLTIADATVWHFRAEIVASTAGAVGYAAYTVRGLVRRASGTVSVHGVVTETLAESVAGWDATAVADDANKSLRIQVTGAAGTTIRWVAAITMAQVGFPAA